MKRAILLLILINGTSFADDATYCQQKINNDICSRTPHHVSGSDSAKDLVEKCTSYIRDNPDFDGEHTVKKLEKCAHGSHRDSCRDLVAEICPSIP